MTSNNLSAKIKCSHSLCEKLALFIALLTSIGCCKAKEKTLFDLLKEADGIKVEFIEHLDLTTSMGLPAKKNILEAKVLKRISTVPEMTAFEKALGLARAPENYNYPTVSDDIILRVKTVNGTWVILCRILSIQGTKTCFIESGKAGETDFNRMTLYESKSLADWIDKNISVVGPK